MKKIRTDGNWNPNDENKYFLVTDGGPWSLKEGQKHHTNLLAPIDTIKLEASQEAINNDVSLMIDSGIFNLANNFAKMNNITIAEAFHTSPNLVTGFEKLKNKYVNVLKILKDSCWGYVELDLGSIEDKINTRKELKKEGLSPIPVFHPLSDGWDYFEYLAERYDRICFGNLAQSNSALKIELINTLDYKIRKYPDVWIHLLGFTPNQISHGTNFKSCDSSTWLAAVMFAGYHTRAIKRFSIMSKNYQTPIANPVLYRKGIRMAAYGNNSLERNWNNNTNKLKELGFYG